MKKFLLVLLLIGLLLPSNVSATQPTQEQCLQNVFMLVEEAIESGALSEMMDKVSLFRKAGLSYQPQLTIAQNVDCKTDEEKMTLYGMYMFDSTYALAFGKTKQGLGTKAFMNNTLMPSMAIRDLYEPLVIDPATKKALLENPRDKQAQATLKKLVLAKMRTAAKKIQSDARVMEFYSEALYGAVIQGLYVATTLAEGAPMTPDLNKLFDAQIDRLDLIDDILESLADVEHQQLLEFYERHGVVHTARDILKASGGKPSAEDLENLLALATKARSIYVTPCE